MTLFVVDASVGLKSLEASGVHTVQYGVIARIRATLIPICFVHKKYFGSMGLTARYYVINTGPAIVNEWDWNFIGNAIPCLQLCIFEPSEGLCRCNCRSGSR